MIRDVLTPALQRHFPERAFTFLDTQQPFAHLSAEYPDIGDLEIYDDGDEATLSIREVTHSHFNPYQIMPDHDRDRWIADAVVEFLQALFADRILLYRGVDRMAGGFRCYDSAIDRSSPIPGMECYQCFVWSGQVANTA